MNSGLLADELPSVLDEDTLCVGIHAYAMEVVDGGIGVGSGFHGVDCGVHSDKIGEIVPAVGGLVGRERLLRDIDRGVGGNVGERH